MGSNYLNNCIFLHFRKIINNLRIFNLYNFNDFNRFKIFNQRCVDVFLSFKECFHPIQEHFHKVRHQGDDNA